MLLSLQTGTCTYRSVNSSRESCGVKAFSKVIILKKKIITHSKSIAVKDLMFQLKIASLYIDLTFKRFNF